MNTLPTTPRTDETPESLPRLVWLGLICLMLLTVVACAGPGEEAGDAVDDAADEVEDVADDVADEAEDAIDEIDG